MEMKAIICAFMLVCVVWVNADHIISDIKNELDDIGQHAECASRITSCEECTKNPKCLWCDNSLVQCIPYPTDQIIPKPDVCDLGDARWGVCWVNYKILLISMGCLAGVLILSVVGCICCCCCRRRKTQNTIVREQVLYDRQREERNGQYAERRDERQMHADDIRHKYGIGRDALVETNTGLAGDQKGGYRRFENEA